VYEIVEVLRNRIIAACEYEIFRELLNVFNNPCDVDTKHESMRKEIISNNFYNKNIDTSIK